MKVSIITSFYNDIDNFERTYNSIKLLKEKYSVEYILIDGGSSPKVSSILRLYMDIVDVFVSEQDRGFYDGINKGMLVATGDYIGICNSGDEIDLYGFSVYHSLMSTSKSIDVITGKVLVVDNKSKTKKIFRSRLNNLFFGLPYPHMSLFIKANVIELIGLYDLSFSLSADYDYAKRLNMCELICLNTNVVIGSFYIGGRSGGIKTYIENFRINLKHGQSYFVSCIVLFACVINFILRKFICRF